MTVDENEQLMQWSFGTSFNPGSAIRKSHHYCRCSTVQPTVVSNFLPHLCSIKELMYQLPWGVAFCHDDGVLHRFPFFFSFCHGHGVLPRFPSLSLSLSLSLFWSSETHFILCSITSRHFFFFRSINSGTLSLRSSSWIERPCRLK